MTPLCARYGPSQPSGCLPESRVDDLGAFGDQPRLVLLPQHVLALGIGAAVPDIFVAAPVQPLDDIGAVFEHRRVDVVRAGQAELVEQVEIVPDADPVAVIAPGVIALVLRGSGPGRVAAEPGPKAKCSMLLQKNTASRLPSGQS